MSIEVTHSPKRQTTHPLGESPVCDWHVSPFHFSIQNGPITYGISDNLKSFTMGDAREGDIPPL